MIRDNGFSGLWIAFPKIHPQYLRKKISDMLGGGGLHLLNPKAERWLNPRADIFEFASEVIERFYKMGVMKFKIDMSYNTNQTCFLHKELYRAAKAINQ